MPMGTRTRMQATTLCLRSVVLLWCPATSTLKYARYLNRLRRFQVSESGKGAAARAHNGSLTPGIWPRALNAMCGPNIGCAAARSGWAKKTRRPSEWALACLGAQPARGQSEGWDRRHV
eukprot:3185574-Rhodomonas_salina.3